MTSMVSMTPEPNHYQNHRHHQHHHVVLVVLAMGMLIVGVVRCDYPPPSEARQGFFAKKQQQGGGSKAVSGRDGDGYLSDWDSRDWVMLGNPNPGKCIAIPSNLTLCRGIGYDQMRLPNLLEHDTLKEVSQQASSWVRLLAVRCHSDTQVFLCSLFAPVCLDRPPIWPCRSLCEAVKAGCENRMLIYGFPWPEMLRCDQFPAEDDLCIGLRNENNKDDDSVCSACLPDTFEGTVDSFCRADFAMRIKVKQAIVIETDMKIDSDKKKKIFKTGSLKSNDIRDASLYIVNGANCDCAALDGGIGNSKNSSNFIVMGNRVNDRLILSFVHRLDNKSKEVNRALRIVRKPDACMQTTILGTKTQGAAAKNEKGSSAQKGSKSKGRQSSKSNRRTTLPPSELKRTTLKTRAATTATIAKKNRQTGRARKEQKSTRTSSTLFY